MDELLIGADPEFSCYESNNYRSAHILYNRSLYTKLFTGNGDFERRIFGYDGNSCTGEIRPAPAYTAEDFENNIRKCLALGYYIIGQAHNISKIELKAGSYWNAPLGGHIHIATGNFCIKAGNEVQLNLLKHSQINKLVKKEYPLSDNFRGEGCNCPGCRAAREALQHPEKEEKGLKITGLNEKQKLIKYRYFIANTLDATIGLGLKLIESPSRGRKRAEGYGKFTNYLNTSWGIEYRTPPSWIVSPEMVKAVFELTRLSIINIVNDTKHAVDILSEENLIDRRDHWNKLYNVLEHKKFHQAFRNRWLRVIEKLPGLAESKYIDFLITLIQNNEKWDDTVDLFKTFNIGEETNKEIKFIDPANYYKAWEEFKELCRECPQCGEQENIRTGLNWFECRVCEHYFERVLE